MIVYLFIVIWSRKEVIAMLLLLVFYLPVIFIWCIAYAQHSHRRVFERRHLMLGHLRIICLQQLQGHVRHLHEVHLVLICHLLHVKSARLLLL